MLYKYMVSSASEFGSCALIPIGYGVAGWATERIGAPLVFLVGGGLTAVVAALVLAVHQGVRRLERGSSTNRYA